MSWEEAAAELQEATIDTFRDDDPVPYVSKATGAEFDLRIDWSESNVAVAAGDRTVNASNIAVRVKLADYPPGVLPGRDDTFVRKGVTWVVQPGTAFDGQGGAILRVVK